MVVRAILPAAFLAIVTTSVVGSLVAQTDTTGGAPINLRRVRERSHFMQQLLRDADQSFFHWALDSDLNLFAGFTFTLESGFPTAAIEVVVRSIPLLDRSVGGLEPLIE